MRKGESWVPQGVIPAVLLYIFTGSRSASAARATHTPINPTRAIRRVPRFISVG